MIHIKKWYKSKSIWIGVIEILGGTLAATAGMMEEGLPVTAAGVFQIILRLVTKEAIARKQTS